MISTFFRAHCVTLLQHTDVDGAMQRLLTHEGRLQPNSEWSCKTVRLTSPWSRSLTQHLINKASPAPIWTIEPLILEYFIVQNQNTSARIQLVSIWSSQTEFQRFFTSFASVLVAVTQTGLRWFSLNIYLEIKPHTCFSLLLIQLSFSLKVLTVININKQTLTDWDRVMLNWMSAELMKQFLKLPVWINHSPSTWEEPLFYVSLQL